MTSLSEGIYQALRAMSPGRRTVYANVLWTQLRNGAPKEAPFAPWLATVEALHIPCGCKFTEFIGEHCACCKQQWPCNIHTLVQHYQQATAAAAEVQR